MIAWWEDNGPPVYIAAAGYLGLIKDPKSKKKTDTGKPASGGHRGNDLNELLKMAGRGGEIRFN